MKKRVLLAMSGGVDSSVAAFLLQAQGYHIVGATLKVWSYEKTHCGRVGTKSDCDFIEDAQKLAEKLNIEHHLLDVQDQFQETIIQYFMDSYLAGETPNPCVVCNPIIKWGTLIKLADQLGCDYIATGHYVQVEEIDGRYTLKMGADTTKDQSYVLWQMPQEYLARTLFPLGKYKKEEIKEMAHQHGIHKIADKRESYDVCFIPSGDYRLFLQLHKSKETEALRGGVIADKNGKWLGKHKGFPFYTIGQRKGLEVAVGHPVYVTQLDPENNRVILGEKEDLMANFLVLKDYNIIKYKELPSDYRATVRIRYKDKGAMATITRMGNELHCFFDTPISAATPGQSGVIYEGDILVGGGTISQAHLIVTKNNNVE